MPTRRERLSKFWRPDGRGDREKCDVDSDGAEDEITAVHVAVISNRNSRVDLNGTYGVLHAAIPKARHCGTELDPSDGKRVGQRSPTRCRSKNEKVGSWKWRRGRRGTARGTLGLPTQAEARRRNAS